MKREQVKDGIKWKSYAIYVDTETGLIISKKQKDREYIIIRRTKNYKINGNNGIIEHINECEKDRQIKIW